jgi:hypothetical protein
MYFFKRVVEEWYFWLFERAKISFDSNYNTNNDDDDNDNSKIIRMII